MCVREIARVTAWATATWQIEPPGFQVAESEFGKPRLKPRESHGRYISETVEYCNTLGDRTQV